MHVGGGVHIHNRSFAPHCGRQSTRSRVFCQQTQWTRRRIILAVDWIISRIVITSSCGLTLHRIKLPWARVRLDANRRTASCSTTDWKVRSSAVDNPTLLSLLDIARGITLPLCISTFVVSQCVLISTAAHESHILFSHASQVLRAVALRKFSVIRFHLSAHLFESTALWSLSNTFVTDLIFPLMCTFSMSSFSDM